MAAALFGIKTALFSVCFFKPCIQQDQEVIIHTYHGQVHLCWNSLNKLYSGKPSRPQTREWTVPSARS